MSVKLVRNDDGTFDVLACDEDARSEYESDISDDSLDGSVVSVSRLSNVSYFCIRPTN
jgi:hypothetical protein